MQLSHKLGGLNIRWVLFRISLGGVASKRSEKLDVLIEVPEFKFKLFFRVLEHVLSNFRVEIVKFESLEITYKDVFGQFRILKPGKIISCLLVCSFQIPSTRFHLYQDHARPNHVNVSVFPIYLLDLRFEGCNSTAWNTKDVKEGIEERFRFRMLRRCVLPLAGEGYSAVTNLIPG